MPVTLTSLEVENSMKVKAVHMLLKQSGLTIIGGDNGQGKTATLKAIMWALGGKKFEPSNPKRDGAMSDPRIDILLSNGIRVLRSGKNGALKVVDPDGKKGGQQLLDSFISQFALDLPKFMDASTREKAETLLAIIGVGPRLAELDKAEQRLYNERHSIGQIALAKKKHAEELPEYAGVPAEPVSASALIKSQQVMLAKNGENQRKRERKAQIEAELAQVREKIAALQAQQTRLVADLADAGKDAAQLVDESTSELEKQLEDIEAINAQVAANLQKAQAADDAAEYQAQYDAKSTELDKVREERAALLDNAALPLPGLTVGDGELLYNGQKWDCMSGSEQLRVATAIVRAQSPECGFVLMDKLEQMDLKTLAEFGAWLEQEGLQVIATRVSKGDECSIIIEDGLPQGQTYADVVADMTVPIQAEADNQYGEF